MKRNALAYGVIGVILIVTLFFLKGNKFDTGERFILTLLVGAVAILIIVLMAKSESRALNPDRLLLGGFLALSWLSFFFSETKNFGFSEMFVLTACIGIFFAIGSQKPHIPKFFLKTIVVITVASSIFGLIYFMTQFEPRMAGPFFDPSRRAHFFPNTFALFLLMTWPIAAWLMTDSSRNEKKYWWLALTIILTALFFTYSRGAWAVLILQAVVLLASQRTYILKFMAVLACTALIIVGVTAIRGARFPMVDVAERVTFQNETRKN